MKLRYEVTLDDLVAFNRYHSAHSPAARRVKAGCTWGIALFFLLLTAVITVQIMEPAFLAAGVAAAALWMLFYPQRYQRHIDRYARRLYQEGSNKSLIGPHELELTENDLVERTPFGEFRVRLQVIERVVCEGSYTFIYLSAVTAHVIPHHAVSEGDREAFVAALKERLSAIPQEASAQFECSGG